MKNSSLKNKFEDFEPEIDDSTIDQNWNKIKPLLVKDDRFKKRVIFFLVPGIVLIAFSIYFLSGLNLTEGTNDKPAHARTTRSQLTGDTSNLTAPITHDQQPLNINNIKSISLQSDYLSGKDTNSKNTGVLKIQQPTPDNETVFNHSKTGITTSTTILDLKNKESKEIIFQKTDLNENKASRSQVAILKPEKEPPLLEKKNKNLSDEKNKNADRESSESEQIKNNTTNTFGSSENSLKKVDFTTDHIEPFTIISIDYPIENRTLSPKLMLNDVDHSVKNTPLLLKRFYLDLLVGLNFTNTKTNNSSSGITDKTCGKNVSVLINAGYLLNKRTSINAQFLYNTNSINNGESNNNPVYLNKTSEITYSSQDTTYYLDTIIKYTDYNNSAVLKSNQSFNVGLGISYNLATSTKFSIEGMLFLNLKNSKYSYQKSSGLTTDTVITHATPYSIPGPVPVYQHTNPDLNNYPSATSLKTASILSLGIMPGFNITYKLTNSFNFVLRCSYLINMPDRYLNFNEVKYKINENSLMIHAGIRLKF